MNDHSHQPKVCIAAPTVDTYSHTFIRAHINKLPFEKKTLVTANIGRLVTGSSRKIIVSRQKSKKLGAKDRIVILASKFVTATAPIALEMYFRRNKISVVLAEYGQTGVLLQDACRNAGIPLIVHFHGYDAYTYDALNSYGKHYPDLFSNAAKVVAVSHHMEKQLIELGAPRDKVHYNPCGVDLDLFSSGQPELAAPIFLSVGRFVDKKAPHLTLLAYAKIHEVVPDSRLVMVGDGVLLGSCKLLARSLGIHESVSFKGVLDQSEIAELMRKSRAFVQHSVRTGLGDSEGTPVVILEASAAGLPVISTWHAGIPDVVVDGKTGFLVKELDVDDMAEKMIRVATNAELAGRLGRAARGRIETHFSMDRSIKSLSQLIEEAARYSPVEE